MKRRTFFQRLFGGLGVAATSPAVVAGRRPVLMQESAVAGFQFHRGEAIWPSLAVGDALTLAREPSNEHDSNAVAVYAGRHRLGYVPRAENRVIAQMLDRGESLEASISRLRLEENPWERIRIRVFLA